jgi:hypothetical protein
MAGYSGTPLVQKLGIKSHHRVALVAAPPEFVLGALPAGAALQTHLRGGALDVILFFAASRSQLSERYAALAARLTPAGGLWIAWPKKASGMATDLSEDIVRAIGLEAGLVDNKVCAVDETWSGLRFVIRLADRPRNV